MALAHRVMIVFRRLVSIASETTSHRHSRLVPIDLPVDLVVVLEQQERASQAQRFEKALVEPRCT
jgi:hypothetical protein